MISELGGVRLTRRWANSASYSESFGGSQALSGEGGEPAPCPRTDPIPAKVVRITAVAHDLRKSERREVIFDLLAQPSSALFDLVIP